MRDILKIETISQLYSLLELGIPKHKQIALINYDNIGKLKEYCGMKISTAFYLISLKNGSDCELRYGRQYYDFSEGSLIYTAPNQVIVFEAGAQEHEGWILCFHPDLIRKTDLVKQIREYSFFDYSAHEALHISDKEFQVIQGIIKEITNEIISEADSFTDGVIASNIELLLNYSRRFYGRQFITREVVSKDIISEFEYLLKKYMTPDYLYIEGVPSVKKLASEIGYSANYLSDLLRKETGKNTKEHIHSKLLELSKNMLVDSERTIASISEMLGFSYPAHFSNFFKKKTGISPVQYRKSS